MSYYNTEDEIIKFLSEKLGVTEEYIKQTTLVRKRRKEQIVDIFHPITINGQYPVTTRIIFRPSTFKQSNIVLLSHYAKMISSISPHFANLKGTGLKNLLTNGLGIFLNADLIGSVSIVNANILEYKKFSSDLTQGYLLSFNPELVKYYKTPAKDALLESVIKPFVDMFFDMVMLHSSTFFIGKGEKLNHLKELIITIFGSLYHKKGFGNAMTIKRSSKKPVTIVFEMFKIGASEKVRVSVKPVDRIEYKGKVHRSVGDLVYVYLL